jgi:anti-sigma regulatory factor (Ser/Thr protein kinase)
VPALELPPTTDSVPEARRFVRSHLVDEAVDVDTAVLLVSEVVTNAVLHARTLVIVSLRQLDEVVRISVIDRSPVRPRIHAFSSTSATGRGLRLLDRLAARWGVDPDPDGSGGKAVWFEVGPPSDAAWADVTFDEAFDEADPWVVEGVSGEL